MSDMNMGERLNMGTDVLRSRRWSVHIAHEMGDMCYIG
jgi:hypothetical protein